MSRQPDNCLVFFHGYGHLLAMYTQIVCKHLTAVENFDVDHICPNLCVARTNPPWKQYEGNQLVDPLDVCGQIPNALPGTCQLVGKGIYDFEFRCQCVTAAYAWKAEPGDMTAGLFPRCEPLFPNFENEPPGIKHYITCNKLEVEYFCDTNGTSACHFIASRVAYVDGNEVVTSLSPWPICECQRGRSGVRCERRLDACEDALPLTSTQLQKLKNEIPEMPPVLTAKWLCEAHLDDSKCVSDMSSWRGEYGYRCECREGSMADKRFGKLDNCRLHTSVEKSVPKWTIRCPPGYAGDNCEMTINPWSAWGQWSECQPICGSHRRRTRRRICLGDFGCYGSIHDAENCQPVKCIGLHDSEGGTRGPSSAAILKEYKENGGFLIPASEEILISTLFCVFLCQAALIALGVCIFWRKEGRCKQEASRQM